MKVTIFGTGYVGLVTGTCLAEVGNDVLCVDIDADKIAQLQQGLIPIFEPGLEALVQQNQTAGRLHFTTDLQAAVRHGLFQFIAVGTPPDSDGAADVQFVLQVAATIADHMQEYRIIINKSTVPVGTADKVKHIVQQRLLQQDKLLEFDVVSNPEFLKEGAAITDFMKPDRIVIGTDNPRTSELLKVLYAPFNRNRERIIGMDIRSAEFTKYAANAMLATKISFMNELANLAEHLQVDIEQVRQGIGSDSRIGYHFIYPGCGYGGSCFPKDIKALIHTAHAHAYQPALLAAVESVNEQQKQVLFDKINRHYQGQLQGKTFALWGLAFKPKTNDIREAPSRVLFEALIQSGAQVKAFDPEAQAEILRVYGHLPGLSVCSTQEETLEGADALCIVTEWKNFWSPDFDKLKMQLADAVIFDGRNLYEPQQLKAKGLRYYAIGRPQA